MAVDLDRAGIDRRQYPDMFKNLQGGILKSHGRNHARLLLLKFKEDLAAGAAFIRQFALSVTKTSDQLAEAPLYDQQRVNGSLFRNFFLTGAGYRHFGFPQGQMDERFEAGMRAWAAYLQDDPTKWERVYRNDKHPIHAMILLADDDAGRLAGEEAVTVQAVQPVAKVLARQQGATLRLHDNPDGEAIEHFGFVDGVSQPLFFNDDIAEAGRTDAYDPAAPLRLVLAPDPHARAADSFGSYLVFRKLRQDVKAFEKSKTELIAALGLKGTDQERAGAMIMGRFPDGTPLTVADRQTGHTPANPPSNNFNYGNDTDGLKCPFQAHARKMNTRMRAGRPDEDERSHRVARRAISYGKRGGRNVGLLFMCYQSNIEHQFEWLQRMVANDRNYFATGTGLDPLIGLGPSAPQKWPVWWGEANTAAVDIHSLVTVKGGEYFFAPSIAFLADFLRPAR